MTDLISFMFKGHPIRAIVLDGEAHFVGKDVADRLGYIDAAGAIAKHCKGSLKRLPLQTDGGMQEVRVLSEPDVLRLIIRSKLPEAIQFERWVFEEVLPSIRRDGGYMIAAPDETPEALALRAMRVLQATVDRQKAQLAVATPKAEALDRIATADGALSLIEAAKALQVRPKDFMSFLSAHGWTYRRAGSGTWLGYQSRTNSGDLTHKVTTIHQPDGDRVVEQVKVTPQGLAKLAKLMPNRTLFQ